MPKKKTKRTKTGKRKVGRPSKGPTVDVSMRLSKDLSDRIDALRRRMDKELTRTAAFERLLREALRREEKILDAIINEP